MKEKKEDLNRKIKTLFPDSFKAAGRCLDLNDCVHNMFHTDGAGCLQMGMCCSATVLEVYFECFCEHVDQWKFKNVSRQQKSFDPTGSVHLHPLGEANIGCAGLRTPPQHQQQLPEISIPNGSVV